ncbi:MAG: hypothetical protein ACTHLE_17475 [Agriterribacter sp.]
MEKCISLLLFILTLSPVALLGQEGEDEIFHELEVACTYVNNTKWRGAVAANWKHIYDETGWRRWGGDAYISRKIKFIAFEAGVTSSYTFDKDIVNYWEVRPWVGIRSDFELGKRLVLMQKFKVESRHFFYEDSYSNEQRTRNRFLLSLKYNFLRNRKDWKLNPTAEWYFVGKAADAERFSNSVEFGLRVIKVFPNEHEMAIGYKRESYKSEYISNSKHGHIFMLEYAF